MLNNNVLSLLGVFASALGGCSKYESQKPPTISTLEYQTPGFLYVWILSVSIVEWNTLPLSDRASKMQYRIWVFSMSILIVLLWCILPNAIAWMKLSQTNCYTNSLVHLYPLSLRPWSSCPLCLVGNSALYKKHPCQIILVHKSSKQQTFTWRSATDKNHRQTIHKTITLSNTNITK